MALASNPREALLQALNDLEENDFKILKFHLRDGTLLEGPGLARGELEGLSRVDLASRLISMYGAQEAVKVVLKVLKVMHLLELVDQLSHVCLNGEFSRGEGRSGWYRDSLPTMTFPETTMADKLYPLSSFQCLRVLVVSD